MNLRLGRLSRPFVHTGDKIDRAVDSVDFQQNRPSRSRFCHQCVRGFTLRRNAFGDLVAPSCSTKCVTVNHSENYLASNMSNIMHFSARGCLRNLRPSYGYATGKHPFKNPTPRTFGPQNSALEPKGFGPPFHSAPVPSGSASLLENC